MTDHLERELSEHFQREFGVSPHGTALAPGRVNLIGEHTDYNDGFVLPMGLERYIGVAFTPRKDRTIDVFASDYNEHATIDLDRLESQIHQKWTAYIEGVAWALQQAGYDIQGANLVVHGNVPVGAGLSSSAALEVALALAMTNVSDVAWKPEEMAQLAQRAENDYVGVSCGIMDQFAAAMSRQGHALLLDCRSLETQYVPLPDDVAVVTMDTGVRRSLAQSSFNARHDQCQEAVRIISENGLDIQALRDLSLDQLKRFEDQLGQPTYNRALHVVTENERTLQMAKELANQNPGACGKLMSQSHVSLRDLYEVSSDELDRMVEIAQQHEACYGARLTGAGLGGCAVALVESSQTDAFIDRVQRTYDAAFNHGSALFPSQPSEGAHLA